MHVLLWKAEGIGKPVAMSGRHVTMVYNMVYRKINVCQKD